VKEIVYIRVHVSVILVRIRILISQYTEKLKLNYVTIGRTCITGVIEPSETFPLFPLVSGLALATRNSHYAQSKEKCLAGLNNACYAGYNRYDEDSLKWNY